MADDVTDAHASDVVLTAKDADHIDRALTKAITNAIAIADDTPYPDDPRWSPWTRFGKPMAARCEAARAALRRAREAQAPTDRAEGGSR